MFSGVLSCTDTKTWSWTTAYDLEVGVCFFSWRSYNSCFRVISRWLCILVLAHERTQQKRLVSFMSFKICILLCLSVFWRIRWVPMHLCCFQPFSVSGDFSNKYQLSGLCHCLYLCCRTLYMVANILIIRLNVPKTRFLIKVLVILLLQICARKLDGELTWRKLQSARINKRMRTSGADDDQVM